MDGCLRIEHLHPWLRRRVAAKGEFMPQAELSGSSPAEIHAKEGEAVSEVLGVCVLCQEEFSRAALGNSPFCFTCSTHARCACGDPRDA